MSAKASRARGRCRNEECPDGVYTFVMKRGVGVSYRRRNSRKVETVPFSAVANGVKRVVEVAGGERLEFSLVDAGLRVGVPGRKSSRLLPWSHLVNMSKAQPELFA